MERSSKSIKLALLGTAFLFAGCGLNEEEQPQPGQAAWGDQDNAVKQAAVGDDSDWSGGDQPADWTDAEQQAANGDASGTSQGHRPMGPGIGGAIIGGAIGRSIGGSMSRGGGGGNAGGGMTSAPSARGGFGSSGSGLGGVGA